MVENTICSGMMLVTVRSARGLCAVNCLKLLVISWNCVDYRSCVVIWSW